MTEKKELAEAALKQYKEMLDDQVNSLSIALGLGPKKTDVQIENEVLEFAKKKEVK